MSDISESTKTIVLTVAQRLTDLVASRPSGDSVEMTEYEKWGRDWAKSVVRGLRCRILDPY
jgi:hypothetical protein